MNYLLSQIFLCLLAAFILGAIIGWLWKNLSCKKHLGEISLLQQQLRDCQNKKPEVKVELKEVSVATKIIDTQPLKAEAIKEVEEVKNVHSDSDAGTPAFLTKPRNGKADDLKRIKGVGKVLEGILFERGVYHFDQIATWSDENAQWMDTFMKFPGRIEREGWIEQAKLLDKGLETEFSKKVDKNKIYD